MSLDRALGGEGLGGVSMVHVPQRAWGRRGRGVQLACALWCAWVAGCTAPTESLGAGVESRAVLKIVNGRLELRYPAVVFVTQLGGRCSGSLVGRRLVLTAKHCVQDAFEAQPVDASEVSVGVGTDASDPDSMQYYRVARIDVTGGAYTRDPERGVIDLLPDDLAVLTLHDAPPVTPLEIDLGDPSSYEGTNATAVGFGQTPDNAFGGIKMSVATRVSLVNDEALLVGSTVCPGDSGGPLLAGDGRIIGVVSLGLGEECGIGVGFYNRVDLHADVIVKAFERAGEVPGVCQPSGPEVCDGFDNDCDEEIDEGCLSMGQACDKDAQCIGGRCELTPQGRVCTASCDPLNPAVACPDGLHCALVDNCLGLCVPGSLGGKQFGESCERSEECASVFCDDPGDGRKRCLSACRGGEDTCFAGEVCVAVDAECGLCVDRSLVSGQLGLGEACEGAEDCRGGLCVEDGTLRYCSQSCRADHDCPGDAHCRDQQCVRGDRSALGGRCVAGADCAPGLFCTAADSVGFCSRECADVSDCGDGFSCDPVLNGSACVPQRSVLGAVCSVDDECITQLCDEHFGRCARGCALNAACGSGFQCVRRGDSTTGVCLPGDVVPRARPSEGGCSLGVPGRGGFSLALLSLLGGLWVIRRRVA